MKVIREISELREFSINERSNGKIIGVVPTMGSLHDGHLSLVREAEKTSDIVITTLFVNPRQFGPEEDFDTYPRDFEKDYNLAKNAGTDILFAPSQEEMYPEDNTTNVSVGRLAKVVEGEFRPQFFDGIATVVSKLFNATLPNKAYFGQKDYQQSLVIKKLSKDLNFDVEIVVCPIIREENGLAMSSRNNYLSEEQKQKAVILYETLNKTVEIIESGENKRKVINATMHENLRKLNELKIDYAISARAEDLTQPDEFEEGEEVVLLIGAVLGKTRLIDNMTAKVPKSIYNEDDRFKEGLN